MTRFHAHKKAQAIIEFLLILTIILTIFLFIFNAAEKRNSEFKNKPIEFNAKKNVEIIALAINEVFQSGIGSEKTIYISEEKSTSNITLHKSSRSLIINFTNRHYTFPLVTSNFSESIISPGLVTVKYNANGITVSN